MNIQEMPVGEKKFKANIILSPESTELRSIFDYCAEISNDFSPTSGSLLIGEENTYTRENGNKMQYTLQQKKFPEIFEMLVKTEFFTKLVNCYLLESGLNMSYEEFVGNLRKIEITEENKQGMEKISNVLEKLINENRVNLCPKFPNPKGYITGSDILVNLLNNLFSQISYNLENSVFEKK